MSGGAVASDDEPKLVAGGASFFGVGDPAVFLAGDAEGIFRGLAADTADMVVR